MRVVAGINPVAVLLLQAVAHGLLIHIPNLFKFLVEMLVEEMVGYHIGSDGSGHGEEQ